MCRRGLGSFFELISGYLFYFNLCTGENSENVGSLNISERLFYLPAVFLRFGFAFIKAKGGLLHLIAKKGFLSKMKTNDDASLLFEFEYVVGMTVKKTITKSQPG